MGATVTATPALSEQSRRVLTYIERQLRLGFSGRFELECHQGGVRKFAENRLWSGPDLAPGAEASSGPRRP